MTLGNMKVFVFPGQGSQKIGMGADLFDAVPEYSQWEADIDAILGCSLRTLCLQDPDGVLNHTQFTQPAVYTINALHYLKYRSETGEAPEAVAGHSLGEFNALWVAGAYDFLDGLRLVKTRGLLMAEAKGGGMAAVVGLEIARIQARLVAHQLSALTMAHRNSPTQVVLSGALDQIESAGPVMKSAGCRLYSVLPVSAAFHSPHMKPAAEQFGEVLKGQPLNALECLVVANQTASPYPMGGDSDAVRSLLTRQMNHPVLWTDSIRFLLRQGASEFLELGPGKVLTRLIRQIRKAL